MSDISGGVGDGLGAPQQQSIFERETTAQVAVAKASLLIVPDTLQISLIDIGTPWNYKASPDRPTLAPLMSTRMSEPSRQEDNSWKEQYQALVDDLPAGVRMKLEANLELPPDKRDPAYVSLGNLLVSTAKTLAVVAAPDDSNIEHNSALASNVPYSAANAMVNTGSNYFSGAWSLIDNAGANNPNTDKLSYTVRQGEANLTQMGALVNQMQRTGDVD